MCGRLDKVAVHGRDHPFRLGLDDAPGRLDDAQVIVDAKTKAMSRAARNGRKVALARRQHDSARRIKAQRSNPL